MLRITTKSLEKVKRKQYITSSTIIVIFSFITRLTKSNRDSVQMKLINVFEKPSVYETLSVKTLKHLLNNCV